MIKALWQWTGPGSNRRPKDFQSFLEVFHIRPYSYQAVDIESVTTIVNVHSRPEFSPLSSLLATVWLQS